MWSVGCIMAEMMQGKPLFKGRDRILAPPCFPWKGTKVIPLPTLASKPLNPPWCSDLDQLTEIMKVTGTPSQEFISQLDSEDVSAGEMCLWCRIRKKQSLFISTDSMYCCFFVVVVVCRPRLKTTSKVFRKWKRKTFTLCFLSLIPRVGFTQPLDDVSSAFCLTHTLNCVFRFLHFN